MNNFYGYPYYGSNNMLMAYYVNSYSDVLNAPVSSNGEASLFVNLNEMKMYSKKMINGQSYIQEYSITPINNVGSPETKQDPMEVILAELQQIKNDVSLLKGEPNESK